MANRLILVLILVFLSIPLTLIIIAKANAQIYTCTDKNGVIHFTNVPTDKRFSLHRPYGMKLKADPYKHRRYDAIINWAARKYGLDSALIKAIIRVESNFDPRAVSRKGARGLMQLMPETVRRLAVNNPFDPSENIDAGVRFFRHLMSQLNGDMVLALAAYNSGLSAVRKYNSVPPFAETARFVKKVLHFFSYYQ